MKLTDDLKQTIYREVSSAPHGEKTAVKQKWADRIWNSRTGKKGISLAKLQREIDFGNGKTSPREPEYPDDHFHKIASVKAESEKMGAKMRSLATEDAIDILEQAGEIPKGITRETADRRIRKLGYYKPRSYSRHEDEYVNQYHYLDFSRSELYEYSGTVDGEDIVTVDGRRGGWSYKNKAEIERKRLWLVGYIDTYSRAALFRYFPAKGESLVMAAQFFRFAWQREDPVHPMIHLPAEVLKLDQGSVGKSHATQQRLHDKLDIRVELAAAKNNRHADHQSMGKVERQFRTVWQKLELKTAYILKKKGVKTISLADLNTLAHEYACERLTKAHPVRSGTIAQVYQSGLRKDNQRVLKTDIMDLLFTEDTRVVSSYNDITITQNGEKTYYKVPEGYRMQTIKWYRNTEGLMMGSSMDGKDEFPLVAFDPSDAKGTRIHEQTYREKAAANPIELDGSKLSVTSKADQKKGKGAVIKTLPAREKEVVAESPFNMQPKNIDAFTDWRECRKYICSVNKCRWTDFAEPTQDLYLQMFETGRLTREIIDDLANTAS